MNACLWVVGIALAGQVGTASDDRYSVEDSRATLGQSAGQEIGQPWEDQYAEPGYESATGPPASVQLPADSVDPLTSQGSTTQPPAGASSPADPYQASPATVPNQRAVAAESTEPAAKPSQLLRTLMERPLSDQLEGVPLALGEFVASAPSRERQTRRVELYWELSRAVGDYYLSLLEATQVAALRQGVLQPDPAWQRAEQQLRARVLLAKTRAVAAQQFVQGELARPLDAPLPLPKDQPHCGAYDTRHDQIFRERPNRVAEHLHELLPQQYQGLRREAEAVARAFQWLDRVSTVRNPQSGGLELLLAYQTLAVERQNFLALVCDYNVNIARYTELALPGPVDTGRLVATLIQLDPNRQSRDNGIRRTSSEEPANEPSAGGGSPTNQQGSAPVIQQRPALPLDDASERSILVTPSTGR